MKISRSKINEVVSKRLSEVVSDSGSINVNGINIKPEDFIYNFGHYYVDRDQDEYSSLTLSKDTNLSLEDIPEDMIRTYSDGSYILLPTVCYKICTVTNRSDLSRYTKNFNNIRHFKHKDTAELLLSFIGYSVKNDVSIKSGNSSAIIMGPKESNDVNDYYIFEIGANMSGFYMTNFKKKATLQLRNSGSVEDFLSTRKRKGNTVLLAQQD